MESTLDGILLRNPSRGTLVPLPGNEAAPVLAVLFVRAGVGGVDHFPVHSARVRLGRASDNDIVLAAASVAPEHAELRLEGGLWSLRDFGTPTGSRVDGVPVAGTALLAPGSEFQVGEVRLAFDPQDCWEDSLGEVSPELVRSESESPSRRAWWIAAVAAASIVVLAYILLQAR